MKSSTYTLLLAVSSLMLAWWTIPAFATCPTFHNITNGSTADANQVMDNFNYTLGCPNFTGNVGIGMTASNILDITQNQNAASNVEILNNNGGGGALARLIASNGSQGVFMGVFGTGFTTSGANQAGRSVIGSDKALVLEAGTGVVDAPIIFAPNHSNAETARFATDGSFLVGTTSNGGWSGDFLAEFRATGDGASFYTTSSSYGNSALMARVDSPYNARLMEFRAGSTEVANVLTDGTSVIINGDNGIKMVANSGGVVLSSGATSWSAISDERLKNWDIPQVSYRSAIKNLWVGDYRLYSSFAKTGGSKDQFGLRAQQAYKVLPAGLRDMVVHKGGDKSRWTVSAEPLAFLALWATKDLYGEQSTQQSEIADLKSHAKSQDEEIAALIQANDNLRAELQTLHRQILASAGNRKIQTAKE